MSNPIPALDALWNYRHLAECLRLGLRGTREMDTLTLVQRIFALASQTRGLSFDEIAMNPIETITQVLMHPKRNTPSDLEELTRLQKDAIGTYLEMREAGMPTEHENFLQGFSTLIYRTYFALYPAGFFRCLFVEPYEQTLALADQPFRIIGFVLPPGKIEPHRPQAGDEVTAEDLRGMLEVVEKQGGHCLVWN